MPRRKAKLSHKQALARLLKTDKAIKGSQMNVTQLGHGLKNLQRQIENDPEIEEWAREYFNL